MRFASIAVGAAACVSTASGSVVSTFDTDADGWGVTGDANNFTWSATGGNTGGTDDGYVFANDVGQGIIWNFNAPAKFLGDQSAFVGGMLSWDLIQISTPGSDIDDQPDVVLVGAGQTLVIDAGASPATTWTPYSVSLSTASDWRVDTLGGAAATDAQIAAVLGNLTSLEIRGEFRDRGGDDAGLDNIMLVPAPGSLAVLGVAGLAATRRRRG